MPRQILRTATTLSFIAAGALALSACYEVENGPAFSGGDEVSDFESTLYTVGRISPSDGEGFIPVEAGDTQTWHIRRALNGSYFLSQLETDEDDTVMRPRRIRRSDDYVIEFSTAQDENWLGILSVEGRGDDRRYNFCIHLNVEDEVIVARAPSHNVRASAESYAGVSLGADNPDHLFNFMVSLWRDSELNDWECTVMGPTPPDGATPDSGGAGKVPGK